MKKKKKIKTYKCVVFVGILFKILICSCSNQQHLHLSGHN